MSETQKTYLERLKLALLYAVAVLVFAALNSLAARWLGPDVPKLEAPVIVVAPGGDGPAPVVHVLNPKGP